MNDFFCDKMGMKVNYRDKCFECDFRRICQQKEYRKLRRKLQIKVAAAIVGYFIILAILNFGLASI